MYLNGIVVSYNIISVADLGVFGGFDRTPLWAAPSILKSTDDRLMEPPPPSLATKLRKLLLWLTLAYLSRKFAQTSLDWTDSCSQNGRGFSRKWVWLLKFRAQEYIRTPLQEMLDPPLYISDENYYQLSAFPFLLYVCTCPAIGFKVLIEG